MATITVRIDDQTRDALQARAEGARQTLSDFVRDRLQDAVFDFRDEEPDKSAGGFEPDTLAPLDRHMLALLHRILGRVLPEDANGSDGDAAYQLERAAVLERGFTRAYSDEFLAIQPELSQRHCDFVMDVLDMFRIALYSIEDLRKRGVVIDESFQQALTFDGFDHNDRLEGQMSDYVRYLVEDDKWAEQKDFVFGRDRGNSHFQAVPMYSRMLSEYREVKQNRARATGPRGYFLSEDELRKIAAARIHPSKRLQG